MHLTSCPQSLVPIPRDQAVYEKTLSLSLNETAEPAHSTHTRRKYRHKYLLHQIAASCPFILSVSSVACLFCTVYICFHHRACIHKSRRSHKRKTYWVVYLELYHQSCTGIHKTISSRTTPVFFVSNGLNNRVVIATQKCRIRRLLDRGRRRSDNHTTWGSGWRSCRWSGGQHHHGDCGTRQPSDAGAVLSRSHGSKAHRYGKPLQ
jgi:hypothetical protein